MKVIERATTPNGIEIQIEDWSANYNFMAYAGTVAAYPIAQESGRNQFEPKIGEKFRLAFDFKSTELAATCFEQLKTGKKRLTDYAMEDKNQLKIIKTKAKAFEVVKSYYKDLDDLAARLQADYAAGEDYKPFEQQEQDRLALCFILDYFDDLKTQIKTIKKERKNYGK